MSAKIPRSSSHTNFIKSLNTLVRSVSTPIQEPRDLSGIIKDFEMVYELSWKVLKVILREAGNQTLGAKDVYTQAFKLHYIDDEKTWLQMIEDRNKTSHVYDENDARDISIRIKDLYLPAFQKLRTLLHVAPSEGPTRLA